MSSVPADLKPVCLLCSQTVFSGEISYPKRSYYFSERKDWAFRMNWQADDK